MDDHPNAIDPFWMNGFEDFISPTQKEKKKLERITFQQRELLLEFICENPEMITHSSTPESEKALWDQLVFQLNELRPQKKLEFWKMFWTKWIKSVNNKPHCTLTLLDYRLMKFLINIGYKSQSDVEDVNAKLIELKKEKAKNKIELDNLDYKIVKLKKEMTDLKQSTKEKRKLDASLDQKIDSLLKKKNKLANETNSGVLNQSTDSSNASINESY